MDIKELMIGDWVNVTTTNQPRKIAGTNDLLFHDDYDPILLTEDILVKNGFKYSMPYNDWTNADCNFYLYEGGNGFRVQNTDIKLDYVHQLQHLLWLVGVQKEIEL